MNVSEALEIVLEHTKHERYREWVGLGYEKELIQLAESFLNTKIQTMLPSQQKIYPPRQVQQRSGCGCHKK